MAGFDNPDCKFLAVASSLNLSGHLLISCNAFGGSPLAFMIGKLRGSRHAKSPSPCCRRLYPEWWCRHVLYPIGGHWVCSCVLRISRLSWHCFSFPEIFHWQCGLDLNVRKFFSLKSNVCTFHKIVCGFFPCITVSDMGFQLLSHFCYHVMGGQEIDPTGLKVDWQQWRQCKNVQKHLGSQNCLILQQWLHVALCLKTQSWVKNWIFLNVEQCFNNLHVQTSRFSSL